MAVRRSPQEKKALSYAKDRRNDYGENDKSSRKNIPPNQTGPERAHLPLRGRYAAPFSALISTLDPLH
jgi:hypothetical protein